MTVVLLGGCLSEQALPPSPAIHPPETAERVPTQPKNAEQDSSVRSVRKPDAPADDRPAKAPAPARETDDFGLPLVIVMEAPEVPAEIRGPSPPIKEEPEDTSKKKRGWWW